MHHCAPRRVVFVVLSLLWSLICYADEPVKMSEPEYGFDRQMGDYFDFEPDLPDPTLCEDRCEKESRCRAWSYVKPHSVKGAGPRCFLKYLVAEKQKVVHAVSGIKIRP
jgi:hypothetical protein